MPKPRINTLQSESSTGVVERRISSPTPRHKKQAPQYLQEAEITALFRVISSPRDKAIFRVAYHAGLRASEVGLLDMRDYDPRTERLNVTRLKGSNSGYHHLVREEARALRAWLKVRGDTPGPIFLSRLNRPIGRKMLHKLIRGYGAAAGIPPKLRHFHVLKHSCCTHLLAKGQNVEMVQDWVGHADIRNTMRYAKVVNRRRDEMARQLQDWR